MMMVFSVGLAFAQDLPEFKKLDNDGDGKVAVEKAIESGIPEHVAKSQDLDDDGQLTSKDWKYVKQIVESPPKPAE